MSGEREEQEREPSLQEILRTAPRGRKLTQRISSEHAAVNDWIREQVRDARSGNRARRRRSWPFASPNRDDHEAA